MIRAECHSDDRVVEATFDATPWFEQVEGTAILALKECGWGGDYAADAVAHFMAGEHDGVKKMFDYLEIVADKKDTPGFECYVVQADALTWLASNRPELHEVIMRRANDSEAVPRSP